jgi:hypothetical protein
VKKYFPFIYFIANVIILVVLFYPAREGRFVHDFIGWASSYNRFTWSDVLHCRGDQSFHVMYHVIFYGLYKLLQTHATEWLIVIAILHSGIVTLIFLIIQKILKQAQIRNASSVALIGSFLGLLNPYVVEILIWGATIEYFICIFCLLASWLLLIYFLQERKIILLIIAQIFFAVAIYSLELAVTFPAILFLYFYYWPGVKERLKKNDLIKIIVPQVILIFSYFLMNKVFKGDWVGHYGAAVHLHIPPAYMSSQFANYLLKYILQLNYFNYSTRDAFYSFVSQNLVGYILFAIFYILPACLLLFRFKKLKLQLKIGLLLYFFMCLALLPPQNLYFMYLFRYQNDDYGYYFSLFFYVFIVYLLTRKFAVAGYALMIIYFFYSFKNLNIGITDWKNSGNVVQSLVQDYRWDSSSGKVNILCLGDDLNGAYLFENGNDSAFFKEYYNVIAKKNCSPLQQYAYMTMTFPNDSVSAQALNDSTIKVQLINPWDWFMKDMLGLSDYENKNVKVKLFSDQHYFTILFKHKNPGDIYIYQSGYHWEEVKNF